MCLGLRVYSILGLGLTAFTVGFAVFRVWGPSCFVLWAWGLGFGSHQKLGHIRFSVGF